MYYVTGQVARVSRKGSFAAGDERVSVQVIDMGQDVLLTVNEADWLADYSDLKRGEQVQIPCQVRVFQARDGRPASLFHSVEGPVVRLSKQAQPQGAKG